MNITTKLAKPVSYGEKRTLDAVKYIVIHYTGNKGDTARNNADYFATSNSRTAGAHFFVDKKGSVYKSVKMTRTAYAVGGKYSVSGGAGAYYGKCTNANSISIELCDCRKDTNWEQLKAVRQLVKYIWEKCPNAKTVIRHWDVNGKECPAPMSGKENKKWKRFHSFITKGYQFQGKVTKEAALRTAGRVTAKRIGTVYAGQMVKISKVAGKWGRLYGKDGRGRYRWIALSKVKER